VSNCGRIGPDSNAIRSWTNCFCLKTDLTELRAEDTYDELACDFQNDLCRWETSSMISPNSYGQHDCANGPLFDFENRADHKPMKVAASQSSGSIDNSIEIKLQRTASKVLFGKEDGCVRLHVYAFSNQNHGHVSIDSRAKSHTTWRTLARLQDQLHNDRWHALYVRIPPDAQEVRIMSNLNSIHLGPLQVLSDLSQCQTGVVCDFESDNLCALFHNGLNETAFEQICPASLSPSISTPSNAQIYPLFDATLGTDQGHYLTIKKGDLCESNRQELLKIEADDLFVLRFRLFAPTNFVDRVRFVVQSFGNQESQGRELTVWDSLDWQPSEWDVWNTVRTLVGSKTSGLLILVYSRIDVNSRLLALDDLTLEIASDPIGPADCKFDGSFCRYQHQADSNIHWQIGFGRLANPDMVHELELPDHEPGHTFAYVDTTSVWPFSSVRQTQLARIMSDIVSINGEFCVHLQYNLQLRMSSGSLRVATQAVHALRNNPILQLTTIAFSNAHADWMPIEVPGHSNNPIRLVFDFEFDLKDNGRSWRSFVALRDVHLSAGACGSALIADHDHASISKSVHNLNCDFKQTLCEWESQGAFQFQTSKSDRVSDREPPFDNDESNLSKFI
jgi:hypothetical protein